MAHKQVLFRSEAREKILRGASALGVAMEPFRRQVPHLARP